MSADNSGIQALDRLDPVLPLSPAETFCISYS